MDFAALIPAILVGIIIVALVAGAIIYRQRGGTLTMDIGGGGPKAAGGSDNSAEKSFRTRLAGLGVGVGVVLGVLFSKLWSMQLVSSEEYARQAERNRTRTISTEAPRGRILDRNKLELVRNRASLTVVANKSVLDDDIKVTLLANLLGIPRVAVRRKIQDESEGAQRARTVARDVTPQAVAYIDEHSYLFEGVSIEERTQRSYPFGDLASQVLGYTGNVTQEMLDENSQRTDSDAIGYELGDTVGQAGVEYQYENVLQGIRGEQTVYVDANGNVTDYSTTIDAQSGADIVLTLDAKIQRAAEEGLQHAIEQSKKNGHEKCACGAVIVLDAKNGGILAMASAPTFSPSVFSGGISYDDWEAISSEEARYPLMNRAISGLYPSASTIKPLSTFAALDYGVAALDSSYYCSGFWTGFGEEYGQYCWNHSGHGGMDLRNGITYSCDAVFYEIGKAFFYDENQDGLQQTFRRWGLGKLTGVDLPSEVEGRVPDAEWKWNYFTEVSDQERAWQGGDLTNLVIGQGDLLVTPLQMACVYMGLANRGTIWRPHILSEVISQSGEGSVVAYKPEKIVDTTEDPAYFDLVESGLKGVIYEEDPVMTSHFTNLSVTVAGKTGTGETVNFGDMAWFCAYAPMEDPQYVVTAIVEDGGFGSTSAMYAVRDVLGGIYDEPDTSTQDVSLSAR